MAQRKKRRLKRHHYKQLSVFDRTRIGTKHKDGMHVCDIAKLIKRDRSTVIRELARNNSGKLFGYRPGFAHAFCSQERGSNENINGLIRRILPKKTNFRNITAEEMQRIEPSAQLTSSQTTWREDSVRGIL